MGKVSKVRQVATFSTSSSHLKSITISFFKGIERFTGEKKKKWEDSTCLVLMECLHKASLLSSSNQYSNCLELCKKFALESIQQRLQKNGTYLSMVQVLAWDLGCLSEQTEVTAFMTPFVEVEWKVLVDIALSLRCAFQPIIIPRREPAHKMSALFLELTKNSKSM